MRIAVPYADGAVFPHFGHTAQFKLYDTEHGQIMGTQLADTNGQGHGALVGFLSARQVDTLICGGIGGGARNALTAAGITLYAGVSGNADAAVEALLTNTLQFDPDAHCDHHDHDHGEHCGEHGHSCS